MDFDKSPKFIFNPADTSALRKSHLQAMSHTQEMLDELYDERERELLEKQRYEQETLETLKRIEKNTGDIGQIIALLQTSKMNQEKLLEIVSDIQSIAIAKDEEEADGKYRAVMKKITQLEEDASSMDTLLGYGKLVWNGVKAYLQNQGIDSGD